MTDREKAMLWLNSFVKNKEPMTLIPKQLIRLLHDVLNEQQQQIWEFQDQVEYLTDKLKEQEEVEPKDAEMLIIHNGGAEEYVKDIESIVLLAHKDYDIVYCGTFGRSVK